MRPVPWRWSARSMGHNAADSGSGVAQDRPALTQPVPRDVLIELAVLEHVGNEHLVAAFRREAGSRRRRRRCRTRRSPPLAWGSNRVGQYLGADRLARVAAVVAVAAHHHGRDLERAADGSGDAITEDRRARPYVARQRQAGCRSRRRPRRRRASRRRSGHRGSRPRRRAIVEQLLDVGDVDIAVVEPDFVEPAVVRPVRSGIRRSASSSEITSTSSTSSTGRPEWPTVRTRGGPKSCRGAWYTLPGASAPSKYSAPRNRYGGPCCVQPAYRWPSPHGRILVRRYGGTAAGAPAARHRGRARRRSRARRRRGSRRAPDRSSGIQGRAREHHGRARAARRARPGRAGPDHRPPRGGRRARRRRRSAARVR